MKRKIDPFYNCPGAWLGNMPDKDHKTGNIVVDPARIDPALSFLKRRFHVTGTSIFMAYSGTAHPGIKIDIARKE